MKEDKILEILLENQATTISILKEVQNLKNGLNTAYDAIKTLNAKVEANTKAIEEINAKVEANTKAIEEVNAKVEANTKAIEEINAKVEANTQAIEELNTKVDANTKSIAENTLEISKLNTRVDKLEGTVNKMRKENKEDLMTLKNYIDVVAKRIGNSERYRAV